MRCGSHIRAARVTREDPLVLREQPEEQEQSSLTRPWLRRYKSCGIMWQPMSYGDGGGDGGGSRVEAGVRVGWGGVEIGVRSWWDVDLVELGMGMDGHDDERGDADADGCGDGGGVGWGEM